MSKDPKSDGEHGVSRRGLLGKAALAVGAATSAIATRTALARPSDIVIDSAGRVLVDGVALPKPEGSYQEAIVRNKDNTSCTNSGGCGAGTNTGCTNTRGCLKAKPAMSPNSTGTNTNSNVKTNTNSSGGGHSKK